jgi:spermidine synthase
MRFWRWLFVSCYALSGAAALLYQVTWTRLFTLELGHTVAAASTVLAAFMGGLAGGAWLAGRFLPRWPDRLRIYAALEVSVALLAITLPIVLHELRPALAWAYADGDERARFAFFRVTLSLALLGLPAAAMGATFPIAAAWLADASARGVHTGFRSAIDAGMLYAANTAGAAVGAIATGFWLIPAIGLRGTTWVGVGLNIAAALGALWLTRKSPAAPSTSADVTVDHPRRSARSSPRTARVWAIAAPQHGVACAAAGVSGFSALAYEIVWTRLLALVIGPTTYAFATMAAAFITGIALGSAAGARLVLRISQPALWLAAMLVTSAITAWIAIWFSASRLPLLLAYELTGSDGGFESVLARQVLSVGLLLLPTSFALGVTFTMALATASAGSAQAGRDAARVYVANTLGAVAGSLVAGFVLLSQLGLEGTAVWVSRFATIGGIVVAATVLAQRVRRTAAQALVVSVATGCGLLTTIVDVPAWDRDLLSSGAYKYAQNMDAGELPALLRAGTLEYYREGVAGTVSVRRLAGSRALAIDGKVDASNAGDMLTQQLLGVLPVLLHPNPQDLLVIGLGTGVTVGSALASGDVRRAEVVEISPEVVEASALFSKESGTPLQAPGVRLVIGDGRSHLLLTTRKYDVIISEPSNPWMAGVAALFTREFFEAARDRLKPGGVLCQWAHTYEISASDLKSIVGTFAAVFPQGTMWLVGDGDLLLIGTTGDDILSRLVGMTERSRIGSIPSTLKALSIPPSAAPFVLMSQFAGGPSELLSYSEGSVLQTDDRMALEFTAPRAMYSRSTNDNVRTIRALLADGQFPDIVSSALDAADARSWTTRGMVALKAEAYEMAYESFRRAVALDSGNEIALRGASEAAAGANRVSDVLQWLEERAAQEPANLPVRVELSHTLAARGDTERAIAAATAAAQIDPDNPVPKEQLASVFADLGDVNRLTSVAEQLVAKFPDRDETHYYYATMLLLQGRASEAASEVRRLLRATPEHPKAHNLLGAACATVGQFDCARIAFEKAISLTPRDPSPYVNLGFVYLETANPKAAAGYFAEALVLDPTSATAREALAQTRAMLREQAGRRS